MRIRHTLVLLAVFIASAAVFRMTKSVLADRKVNVENLEPTSCWFKVPEGRRVFCGYFSVPDRRDRSLTTRSRLAVAVFTPADGVVRSDPVLYLSGGPGGAFGFGEGSGWWWNWVDAVALTHGREFIAVDQRGVGRSIPRIDCPNLRALDARLLQREVAPEEEDKEWLEAVASCRQSLLESGVDLSIFSSDASAADIDELRRALDVKEWNLYGISYGTRLALAIARDSPDGIRSMVLDSVYPPEARLLTERPGGLDLALRLASDHCDDCKGTSDVLARLIERLDRQPVRVPITRPDNSSRTEIVLDGHRLIDALIVALSGRADSHRIANAIASLDRGDNRGFSDFAREFWKATQDEDFSYPVNFSVECREEMPFNDAEEARRSAVQFPMVARHEQRDAALSRRICDIWGVVPDSRADEPVRSSIPTLILAGTLDPVTPVAWAERTLQYLPNAQLLEFTAGHSVTDADPCALKLIAAFLDDPRRRPSADCYPRREGPPIVRP